MKMLNSLTVDLVLLPFVTYSLTVCFCCIIKTKSRQRAISTYYLLLCQLMLKNLVSVATVSVIQLVCFLHISTNFHKKKQKNNSHLLTSVLSSTGRRTLHMNIVCAPYSSSSSTRIKQIRIRHNALF